MHFTVSQLSRVTFPGISLICLIVYLVIKSDLFYLIMT